MRPHQLGFLLCIEAVVVQNRWTSCPQRSMSAIPVNKTLSRVTAAGLLALLVATAVLASNPTGGQAGAQPREAAATAAQAPPPLPQLDSLINSLSLPPRCLCRGTNCFAPNINIFRDPRWGRGSETYGEDPLLTAELAKAYVMWVAGKPVGKWCGLQRHIVC